MNLGWVRSSVFALVSVAACAGGLQGCGSDVPLGTQNVTGGAPGTDGALVGSGGAAGVGGTLGTGGAGGRDVDAAAGTGGQAGSPGGTGGTVAVDAPAATGGQTTSGGVAGTISLGGRVGTGGATGQAGATGAGGSTAPRCGTLAGISCATGYFCDLASQCGSVPDAAGVCMPTGAGLGCTADYNPVCGCDGKTYSNDCTRVVAGVLKLKDGVCTGGTGGGPGTGGSGGTGGVTGTGGKTGTGGTTGTGGNTGNTCGGGAAGLCSAGKYCDLESKCGQIADAVGTCKLTGDIGCTADYNPVCGCDGKTYSNDCTRNGAGVLKASDGACPGADGGTPSYSTAWLAWQAPGGAVGAGPAVVVGGSGFADTWTNVGYFSPETPPSGATGTYNLTRGQLDDLFSRLASVSFSALPHKTSTWAECQSMFYYRACQGCGAGTLSYIFPAQVSPEMDSVWLWFDQLLGATATTNPRNYCNFK